jgi:hypothetical protein
MKQVRNTVRNKHCAPRPARNADRATRTEVQRQRHEDLLMLPLFLFCEGQAPTA